jgi:hypothetical protein
VNDGWCRFFTRKSKAPIKKRIRKSHATEVLEGYLALKAIFARFQAQCPANLDKFGFFYEYLNLPEPENIPGSKCFQIQWSQGATLLSDKTITILSKDLSRVRQMSSDLIDNKMQKGDLAAIART